MPATTLNDFQSAAADLERAASAAFAAADSADALEKARAEFLGRSIGRLLELQRLVPTFDGADRGVAGRAFNELKKGLEERLE